MARFGLGKPGSQAGPGTESKWRPCRSSGCSRISGSPSKSPDSGPPRDAPAPAARGPAPEGRAWRSPAPQGPVRPGTGSGFWKSEAEGRAEARGEGGGKEEEEEKKTENVKPCIFASQWRLLGRSKPFGVFSRALRPSIQPLFLARSLRPFSSALLILPRFPSVSSCPCLSQHFAHFRPIWPIFDQR